MKEWVRPANNCPMDVADREAFKAEIERINAKSVLEFGPGDSTQMLLDLGIGRIVTCEHIKKWLGVAKKRFANEPRVRVIAYTNTVPVEADLGGEKFDLAFVDSPQGFFPMRVAHKGMEDCSRLNTCLFALEHAKTVLLHDALRPLERGTLGRLNALGYHFEFIKLDGIGIARIEKKRELHENQSDSPGASQLGGAPAGAKPKRGRSRVDRRPDRLGAGGSKKEKRCGRSAGVVNADDSDGTVDPARTHSSECSTFGVWGDERDGTVHAIGEGGTGLKANAEGQS